MNDVLAGYAAAGAELIERFEAVSTPELFAPVRDLLPSTSVRVADIGAGTGRDAAWFAAQGHHVLAVEPVEELRMADMSRHKCSRLTWLDDRLPYLAIARNAAPFDLLTLSAVWQHLDTSERDIAIRHLGNMTVSGGLLVMSLRHGVGAPERRVFSIDVASVIISAAREGFDLVRAVDAASVQTGNRLAGVRWTWLALRKVRSRELQAGL